MRKQVLPLVILAPIILMISPNINDAGNVVGNPTEASDSSIMSSQAGHIENGTKQIFWFIHVTDTQSSWLRESRVADFNTLLNESFPTIQPLFMINTGDLVNTDTSSFWDRNVGQWLLEWETYNSALTNASMNSSVYIDMMGNHDMYGDPNKEYYLNYSMVGNLTEHFQYSWNHTNAIGTFAFIGLHTPEEAGMEYPFAVFGSLSTQELDWYEEQLQEYEDAPVTFIFGHHPIVDITSCLSTSGKDFSQLTRNYGVDAYFYGHNHANMNDYHPEIGGVRAIQTGKFTNDHGTYRIVAVDGTGISSEVALVGQWPQGVITNPAPGDHLYGDHDPAVFQAIDTVRVLAWDPAGVNNVQIRVAGGVWQDANNTQGSLWEIPWDQPSFPSGETIEARILGNSGTSTITIPLNTNPEWNFNPVFLMILVLVAVFGTATILTLHRLKHRLGPDGKLSKPEKEKVDKPSAKIFIIKCLIFVLSPLSMGLMLNDSTTLIFALFYSNVDSPYFYYNRLLMAFTGVAFIFCILIPAYTLSKRRRYGRFFWAFFSIGIMIFIIGGFYISKYSISWFSPGYYAMMACDVLLIRRGAQMVSKIKREKKLAGSKEQAG
ncbi:MAG: metallophosphoesterase [Candidatus Hodarchaeota archaeon]